MAGEIEARMAENDVFLPDPVAPVAAYVPFVRTGNLVFVSGQIPLSNEGVVTGHLTAADHVSEEATETLVHIAKGAARLCALNLLAHVKACCGDLDKVSRVVKLTGFVNADASFKQHPQVINGASELMAEVFGDAGQHARAAVGSSGLPLGVIVEVEGVFELSD